MALQLRVGVARSLGIDGHSHWVLHLRHIVVYACIFLNKIFVILVDLVHVEKHFSIDVLSAGDLVVVELRSLQDVVDLVD